MRGGGGGESSLEMNGLLEINVLLLRNTPFLNECSPLDECSPSDKRFSMFFLFTLKRFRLILIVWVVLKGFKFCQHGDENGSVQLS